MGLFTLGYCSKLNLWKYLNELLQFLPPATLQNLLSGIVQETEFTPDQTILLTGLILSSCKNPRMYADGGCKNVVQSLIAKFETLSAHENTKNNGVLKLIALLNVLTLLQEFMNSGPATELLPSLEPDQDQFPDILFSDIVDKSSIDRLPKKSEPDLGNIELLLTLFKTLMAEITFDEWVSCSETSSGVALNNSAGVRYWPPDSPAPSNLQMLIAHKQYVCADILKDVSELVESSLCAEVTQMLAATARKYDRRLELDMDNLDTAEIFAKLEDSSCAEWQLEAYINHVMKDEHCGDILADEARVRSLSSHAARLKPHIHTLLDRLYNSDSSTTSTSCLQHLICKVLDVMTLEDLSNLVQTFHSNYGLRSLLRSNSWDEKLITTLNKYSLGGSDTATTRDLLLLALEDGATLLDQLLGRAAEDSGKVRTCAEAALVARPLCRLGSPDTEDTLVVVQKVVDMLDGLHDVTGEDKRQNIFTFLLSLGQTEPAVCVQAALRIIERVLSEFDECISQKTLSCVQLILDMIKTENIYASMNTEVRISLGVSVSVMLNSLSSILLTSERQLKFKETALEIVRAIVDQHGNLVDILNNDNSSYFKPAAENSTPGQRVHQQYFSAAATEQCQCDRAPAPAPASGHLLGLAPALLPAEWRLVVRAPGGEAAAAQLLEVALGFGLWDHDLGYRVLRSVCSELPASWQNLKLFVRLLSFITVEDQKQLIWSSILSNLVKILEDEDSVMIREVIELLMCIEKDEDNVCTAFEMIKKAMSNSK